MVDTAYLNGSAGEEIAGIQHLGFATREHEAISNLSTTWQLAISTVASTSVSSTGRLRTLCVLKQMVTT